MGWFTGIIVYLMIWWTTLFAVLPWSLKRDEDGTPNDPKLIQKLMINTTIACTLWVIIYLLIETDLISFREIAKNL